MRRYQFWDKESPLYPPLGPPLDRDAVFAQWGWTARPDAKVVISAGTVNGGVILDFDQQRERFVAEGMDIPEGGTDDDILQLIEAWEQRVIEPEPDPMVEATERLAAATEFANLMLD